MSIERIRRKISFPKEENKVIAGKEPYYKEIDIGDFKDFIGLHNGKSFIVCGCGSSLNTYDDFNNNITIGVNDAGKKINCKYLVVVNEPKTFKWNRWESVKNNNSERVFTHIRNLPINNSSRKIIINLGKFEGLNLDNYGFIDYTTNSPYMAIIIAYQMGAKKIGLIGVDFTKNHFFGETGLHIINREIERVKEQYSNLGKELIDKKIKIANLSNESLIDSWPKMTLEEFNLL